MYDEAVDGIRSQLLKRSLPSNLLYVAELEGNYVSPKMDHLVCFLPGVLALGATLGKTEREARPHMSERDMADLEVFHHLLYLLFFLEDVAQHFLITPQTAKELTYTCYQMYEKMPTKLAPEIVYFNTDPNGAEDILVHKADTHNLLRPETVER